MGIDFDLLKGPYSGTITIDGVTYTFEYRPSERTIILNGGSISLKAVHALSGIKKKVCEAILARAGHKERSLPKVADYLNGEEDEDQFGG